MRQFSAVVTANRLLATDTYEIEYSWPTEERPLPGQFFTLRCTSASDPLLRRPFAFSGFDEHSSRASFIYLKRGPTTGLLSGLAPGAQLDILGPLGKSFKFPEQNQSALLFAGGIGLGPVLFLYNELRRQGLPARFFYGARGKGLVPRDCLPGNAEIYTDDGTLGAQGRPAEVVAAGDLGPNPIVYACGPKPMLSRLAELTEARGIPCYVSVEQNMACGVGACMGCNVLVRDERVSVRACAEGPVFDAKELLWN